MRERTTWSRAEIAKTAFGRVAEDPRAMNQDHLKQQPAADAYGIGGPSEFGEDVHPSTGTWKAEQSGGETKRNEIGMPEMRKDTFNHPEKTASDEEALIKKADLAAKVARSMLKQASESAIEDQALALMHMPDAALVETANRLAAQDDEEKEAGQGQNDQGKQAKDANDEKDAKDANEAQGQQDQGKQAKDANDEEQGQGQQDQGQAKQGGQIPEAFKENIQKMKDKAKDKDDDKGKNQQGKEASAGDQFVQALKLGDGQGIQSALQQMLSGALQQMMGQQQQQQQVAQGQNQQQPMAQQVQQQMAQGQQQQQQPMAQQQQMAEDQLLDQMLQDELGQPGQAMMAGAAEPEIQMEASSMDVGEVQLGEADAVLSTLFASNPEYQNAAEASQIQGGVGSSVTAAHGGMGRTASTRTVGTRPSNGVSQIGGASGSNAGGSDVDRLSNLWATAPDVKNVFR